MATRSQAREVVVQLLYAFGSGNEGIVHFAEEILEEQKIKNAQKDFAMNLFEGVLEHLEKLDARIIHQLKEWDFSRIGDMEKSILRLGAYEMIRGEVDRAVVINEAIEIAKNFGSENSSRFINGVLDGVAKNLDVPFEAIQQKILEKQALSAAARHTAHQPPSPKNKHKSRSHQSSKSDKK